MSLVHSVCSYESNPFTPLIFTSFLAFLSSLSLYGPAVFAFVLYATVLGANKMQAGIKTAEWTITGAGNASAWCSVLILLPFVPTMQYAKVAWSVDLYLMT